MVRRTILALLAAVLVTYLLASISATQFVLREVAALGPEITLAVRVRTTLQDLAGLAGSYGPLLLLALALAFPVAAGLGRVLPAARLYWYLLAGFVAVVFLHLIMEAVLGVTGIAAVRTLPGLLSQGFAGAAGGAVFHVLLRR